MDKKQFEEYAQIFKDLSKANLAFHDVTQFNKLFNKGSELLVIAASMCDSVNDLIDLVNLQIEKSEEQLKKQEEFGKRLEGVLADLNNDSSTPVN